MKRNLTLFAVMLLLSSLQAATYYAAPNGTGDGKSQNKPTTFAKGIKLLQNPGDTLYLFSGQYDLQTTDINNLVGTSAKRIVIAGYEGINRSGKYPTILDFRKTEYGKRGLQIKNTCAYLHIKNLTLRYSGKNNLICYASNNLFENLDVYGSADTGFQIREGGNNIVKNVDSHDNFDYQTMSGTTANFGGNADGFADKQFTGEGNHYIGCRAWNNSDDGWDFFQRYSSSNTIIENCICYQNGQPYYNMTNNPRVETDKAWFDSKVGTQMIDRYGNTVTITLEKYPCQGNGNGFKMGGGDTGTGGCQHNLLIHHCLSVANNARGYDQNNNGGKMYIYNCTAYDNYPNYGFTTSFGTNTLQNNISLKSRKNDSYKSQTVVANDHNTWNSGFSCSAADFLSLDTTQILAPRRSDGNLPDGSCLHRQENSELSDAGIVVNLPYNGKAPDLGYFESDGEHHDPDPEPEPQPQPEGTHKVAFVTIPKAAEDKPLLNYLRTNDSLYIVETDASDASVDYADYEVIVLGSKPNSSAAGFTALKGYNKPMVLLKPFLLKNTVWNWGNPVNTPDLSITVSSPEHPLFKDLTLTDGQLQLFSECNTNAVTAISEWYNIAGVETLASPLSLPTASAIADIPAGTDCNGTILPQRMVMIGVSEYSTSFLTDTGKKLIENAILDLLGINMPTGIENTNHPISNLKYIENGKLYIQMGEQVFDALGRHMY